MKTEAPNYMVFACMLERIRKAAKRLDESAREATIALTREAHAAYKRKEYGEAKALAMKAMAAFD